MATIDELLVSIGYSVRETDVRGWEMALANFEGMVAKLGEAMDRFERKAKALFVSATADLEGLHFVAQRTGTSVAGLQAMTYALRQMGIDGGRAGGLMEGFAARLRQFPALTSVLHGLGVRTSVNGAVRDQADVFKDTVRALSGMKSYPLAASYAEALGIPEEAFNVLRTNVDRFERLEQEQRDLLVRYGVNGDAGGASSALLRAGWRQALMTLDTLAVKIAMSIGPALAPTLASLKSWLDRHQDQIVAVCVAIIAALTGLVSDLGRLARAIMGDGQGFLDFLEWATGGDGLVRAIEVLAGGVLLGAAGKFIGPLGLLLTAVLGLVALLSPGEAKAAAQGGSAAPQAPQKQGGIFSRMKALITGRSSDAEGGATGSWDHAGATGSWGSGESENFAAAPSTESVPALAEERRRFAEELKDPDVAARLAAYTRAEVGGQGPQAEQAFIETIMNRAASRGQTIRETLPGSRGTTPGTYFPNITHQRAAQFAADPRTLDRYRSQIEAVLGGSNISGYATGNASGAVGFAGGPQTSAYGGERFGVEGPDIGWARRIRSRASQPKSPFADPPSTPMQVDPIDMDALFKAPPLGSFGEGASISADQDTEIVVHGDPDPTRTTSEVSAAQARVNKGLVDQVEKAGP